MDMNDGYETEARSTISSSSRAERRSLREKERWDFEVDAMSNGRSDDGYQGKLARNFEYMGIADARQEESRMRRSVEMKDGRSSQEMDEFLNVQRMDYEGVRYSKGGGRFSDFDYDPVEMEERPGYLNKGKEKAKRMAHQDPRVQAPDYGDPRVQARDYGDPRVQARDYPRVQAREYGDPRVQAREYGDPRVQAREYGDPRVQAREYGDPRVQARDYEDPRVRARDYEDPRVRAREYGDTRVQDREYGDPRVQARDYEDPRVRAREYGDPPMRPQMLINRNHPNPYQHQQSHGYKPGRLMNDEMVYRTTTDPYDYPPQASKREVPVDVRSSYGDKFSGHLSDDNQGSFDYSHQPRLHTRWPSDLNSEADGFAPQRPHRTRFSSSGQHCRPMAGGAPFLTCCNCVEVLLLPNKVLTQRSNRKKMRCGGCSTLIVFMISENNLVVLIEDDPARATTNGDALPEEARTSSGQILQSMDREEDNTGEYRSHNIIRHDPPSTYTYDAVDDNFDDNNGKKHQPDKVVSSARFSTQENNTSATVIEIPSNEYGTGMSLDSGDGSRGFRQKGSFPGVYDNNYYTNARADQIDDESEAANVTVNGHLIQYRAIKKAEILAGPIKPGNYWYDFRAGFWGLMGGPCCGIIPPFIIEFNYPMPENCSLGNTGVLVNGRELNQKDMNLLGQRGLPCNRDRSYIVEISGRVLDAFTGDELPNLGKLAPSMEKAKRGFGMTDPRMNL